MTAPKTLLELSGADLSPAKIRDASLVLIDFQNEYLNGPIALPGAPPAVASAARLLQGARASGAPVFHVAHKGRPGGLFDRDAERGRFIAELMPQAGEAVVEKPLPNSFAGTDLNARLTEAGRKNLILVGFMTHMCVSATARAALDLGYRVTIDPAGCATRDLPDRRGGVVPADVLHEAELAALSDRFAILARSTDELL